MDIGDIFVWLLTSSFDFQSPMKITLKSKFQVCWQTSKIRFSFPLSFLPVASTSPRHPGLCSWKVTGTIPPLHPHSRSVSRSFCPLLKIPFTRAPFAPFLSHPRGRSQWRATLLSLLAGVPGRHSPPHPVHAAKPSGWLFLQMASISPSSLPASQSRIYFLVSSGHNSDASSLSYFSLVYRQMCTHSCSGLWGFCAGFSSQQSLETVFLKCWLLCEGIHPDSSGYMGSSLNQGYFRLFLIQYCFYK